MISPTLEPIDDVTVVAIDGPAGGGKSSVSKQVARRLGFGYLDTGAAYRALAWHALDHGADTSDSTSVLDIAGDFDCAISLDPDDYWVHVGSTDVTDAIREPRVTDAVSGVARVPAVRKDAGRAVPLAHRRFRSHRRRRGGPRHHHGRRPRRTVCPSRSPPPPLSEPRAAAPS